MIDLPPHSPPALVRSIGDANLGILVARRQWADSACNGREQVTVSFTPPPEATAALTSATATGEIRPGLSSVGFSFLGTCRVWILAGRSREKTCTAVVHELGHAAGLGHTDSGIMAAALDQHYVPCSPPQQR